MDILEKILCKELLCVEGWVKLFVGVVMLLLEVGLYEEGLFVGVVMWLFEFEL